MSVPRAEYDRRLARWVKRVAELDRQHHLLATLRLVAVLAGVILFVLALRARLGYVWLLLPAAAFAVLLVVHVRVLDRARRAKRATGLYERGIERLSGRWSGRGRDGRRFLEGHPYAWDLDLFGERSVFERVSTARTEVGEEALAAWLSDGAAVPEIRARQTAIDELRPALDFREDMSVLADDAQLAQTGRLLAWATAPPIRFSAGTIVLFAVCTAMTLAIAVSWYLGPVPGSLVVAWVLAQGAVVYTWRRALHDVLHAIEGAEEDLALLTELFARIERERFAAPWLAARQSALMVGDVTASRAIGRLRQLVSWLESSTHNLLFVPVTRALLVPEQLAMAIARWHSTYGAAVAEWLRAAGDMEAAASVAAYAYECPADPFPVLLDDVVVFESVGLGHPLIADEVSVRNDVHLGADGPHVLIVSGSNMSGKSTLLRAVGVNVVLALAGAPVRASSLRLGALSIGATLRVQDSLQDGRSRFYAEIERISAVIRLADAGKPLLFLFDEILHGTNSHDRRIGAEGIVRALVSRRAIGLVTTHDLALTSLPSTLGAAAANVHFEDRIENGRMIFDYRMRPGVVEHSNAIALMRAVGLDV